MQYEDVLTSFASRQLFGKWSEKGLQPLIGPGKASLRNLRILFNLPLSRQKSRFHDSTVSKNERIQNLGNINKIN